MINASLIQKLREKTSASMMECKKALEEAGGDLGKAENILKAKGKVIAQKKSERLTSEGLIEAYIHSNKKIGTLLDLRCETDFVAKSEEFRNLAHDLAMQIAAANPKYLKAGDIPSEKIDEEKKNLKNEFSKTNKPPEIIEKMIEGKMNKYFENVCLLSQLYIRDQNKTIKDLIEEFIAKFGENIEVKRFVRFEIG